MGTKAGYVVFVEHYLQQHRSTLCCSVHHASQVKMVLRTVSCRDLPSRVKYVVPSLSYRCQRLMNNRTHGNPEANYLLCAILVLCLSSKGLGMWLYVVLE